MLMYLESGYLHESVEDFYLSSVPAIATLQGIMITLLAIQVIPVNNYKKKIDNHI